MAVEKLPTKENPLGMFLYLILFLTFMESIAGASESPSQAPLRFDQSVKALDLNQNIWFLEDAERRFGEADLLNTSFLQQFKANTGKSHNFGFSKSVWWAKVRLENISDKAIPAIIVEGYPLIDQIDFWLVDPTQGVLSHSHSGDQPPFSADRYVYRLPIFETQIPPGESWLFLRIHSEGTVAFDLTLKSERSFFESRTWEYAFLFALLGIYLVMALYNFFIWLQLRKITYLFYVGFIVCMIFQASGSVGLVVHFFKDFSWFMNDGFVVTSNLNLVFAFAFTLSFLSLRGRHNRLFRLCVLGIILTIVSDLLLIVSYDAAAKLLVLNSSLSSLIIFGIGVLCSLERFRPAYFFTMGWLVMLAGNFIRMAMYYGLLPVSFFGQWGVWIGSVLEIVLLSLALADKMRITEQKALKRIETLNTDLQKEHNTVIALNSNLERMVEEQTREIKSILKHIQIGIIVINSKHHSITETHSESAKKLLHQNNIAHQNVLEVLFKHAQISSEIYVQVANILESCLGESAINFQINSHLFPSELIFRSDHDQGPRILQLDWSPVIDDADCVEKLLLSIIDVTTLKKLESEAAEKSKELEYIGEILNVTPRQFGIFMASAQRFSSDSLRLLHANYRFDKEILKILYINMHTIKGSARTLGFRNLTPLIHELEQVLARNLREEEWDRNALLNEIKKVQDQLDFYQDINLIKLGRGSGDFQLMSNDTIDRIYKFLHQVVDEGVPMLRQNALSLRESLESLTFVRAEKVFREVLSTAEMLARDLDKEVPTISVEDNGILLSTRAQELIRNTFVHIIRNSMDHGLETMQERKLAGKPPAGHLQVKVSLDGNHLIIKYQDDGRGLNLRAIKKLAIEGGIVSGTESLNPEQIAYLIFEAGLSTSPTVSDISGRGVGMSAVKEYIEAANGQISINLYLAPQIVNFEFVPFEFVIRLEENLCVQKAA